MALDAYKDKLPEDLRDAFALEIAQYVPVKEALKHPEINSEFQRQLSTKHETTMATWQKDKLPSLIEEEIKKRSTKQPWEIEIEKLKQENAEKDRQMLIKERKVEAVAKFSAENLPAFLADFAVSADDNTFAKNIETLTGLKAWVEGEVKKALTTAVGSQKTPDGGQSGGSSFDKMTTTELMNYAAKGTAEKQAVLEWQKTKR